MFNARNKHYALLLLVCIAGYMWLGFTLLRAPLSTSIHLCFIKSLTHIPCPSCGSTRAVMAILDGQFLTAFYWNPLGYLILVGLVILPLWLLADLIFKAQSLFDFYHLICDKLKNKKYAIPLLLLLLLNWYWNIKKGL